MLFCVSLLILAVHTVSPTSLVYSLKLRRLASVGSAQKKNNISLSALPLIYTLDRHIIIPHYLCTDTIVDIEEKRRIEGGLLFAHYVTPRLFWGEITIGVEHEKIETCGTKTIQDSVTGLDDIVITIGKNKLLGKDTQLSSYVLAGFPTRRKITVSDSIDPLIGTRTFGIGVGTEVSHCFFDSGVATFNARLQGRFLHFFKRSWDPVLPNPLRYTF